MRAQRGYELRVFLISLAVCEVLLIMTELHRSMTSITAVPSDQHFMFVQRQKPLQQVARTAPHMQPKAAPPPPLPPCPPTEEDYIPAVSPSQTLKLDSQVPKTSSIYEALVQQEEKAGVMESDDPNVAVLAISRANLLRANMELSQALQEKVAQYDNIVLTAATGVKFDYMYFLVSTFDLANTDGKTLLVLCTGDSTVEVPERFKHVMQFSYHDKTDPKLVGTSHVAIRRFLVYRSFLWLSDFKGAVFTMDSRDTVMQQLPFQFYPEVNQGYVQLFSEPLTIRQDECCTTVWVTNCAKVLFGEEEGQAVFNHVSAFPIINAGTVMARGAEMVDFLDDFVATLTDYPCNDQGLLDLLVYTTIHKGRYKLLVEPVGRGHVLTADHAKSLYSVNGNLIKNLKGQPYAVVHMWDRADDLYRIVTSGDYLHWPAELKQAATELGTDALPSVSVPQAAPAVEADELEDKGGDLAGKEEIKLRIQ